MNAAKEVITETLDFLKSLEAPIIPTFVLHDGANFDLSIPTQVLPWIHFTRDLFTVLKNVSLIVRKGPDDAIETIPIWIGPMFEKAWKYDKDDKFAKLHNVDFSRNVENFVDLFHLRSDKLNKKNKEFIYNCSTFNMASLGSVKNEIRRLMPRATDAELTALIQEEAGQQFDKVNDPTYGYQCLGGIRDANGDVSIEGMLKIAEHVWAILFYMWELRFGAVTPDVTAAAALAMRRLIIILESTKWDIENDMMYRALPTKEILVRCLNMYASAIENEATDGKMSCELADFWPDYEMSIIALIDIVQIVGRYKKGQTYPTGYQSWAGSTELATEFVAILPDGNEVKMVKEVTAMFNAKGAEVRPIPQAPRK